jgi:hypothetical protein
MLRQIMQTRLIRRKLLCTGHDNPEVYALQFPQGGSTLVPEAIFAVTFPGQGIARSIPPTAKREVVVTRIRRA